MGDDNVKYIVKSVHTYSDEKIKIIESMPDADTLLVIWDKLLMLAGRTNAEGWIFITEGKPYSPEMLATIFARPLNTVRLALKTFDELGMIENNGVGIYLVNFGKWQHLDTLKSIREHNRKRQEKFRYNQLLLKQGNVSVTLPVTSRNGGEGEGEGEYKEKEKESIHDLINQGRLDEIKIGANTLETIRDALNGKGVLKRVKDYYITELEKYDISLSDIGVNENDH